MTVFQFVLTLAIPWLAVIWGVNICRGRGTWLLAGWNTMSEEKKATYNREAILTLYGRCVVFCGVGAFSVPGWA